MNNDRKGNLSAVSSFSHLLSYFWFGVLKQYNGKLWLDCKACAWKLYGHEKEQGAWGRHAKGERALSSRVFPSRAPFFLAPYAKVPATQAKLWQFFFFQLIVNYTVCRKVTARDIKTVSTLFVFPRD